MSPESLRVAGALLIILPTVVLVGALVTLGVGLLRADRPPLVVPPAPQARTLR